MLLLLLIPTLAHDQSPAVVTKNLAHTHTHTDTDIVLTQRKEKQKQKNYKKLHKNYHMHIIWYVRLSLFIFLFPPCKFERTVEVYTSRSLHDDEPWPAAVCCVFFVAVTKVVLCTQ